MRPLTVSLYLLSLLGSGAGFITLMLVSSIWTGAFSHEVLFYSVFFSFYFLAIGVGSWIADRKISDVNLGHLISVILAQALATGTSPSITLFFTYSPYLVIFVLFLVAFSGLCSGLAIVLTIRCARGADHLHAAPVFFLDYLAAVLYSLLFLHLLLGPLGEIRLSLLISYLTLFICVFVMVLVRFTSKIHFVLCALALLAPVLFYQAAKYLPPFPIALDAKTAVVERTHTDFHAIVLTETEGINEAFPNLKKHSLYIDGNLSFDSFFEHYFYTCLTNIPMAVSAYQKQPIRTALIIGGSNGMSARNLISFPNIEKVTVVDKDEALFQLARQNPILQSYNLNSLSDRKLEIIISDPIYWASRASREFDLVLVDLPPPTTIEAARYYTLEFYSLLARRVSPQGILASYAGKASVNSKLPAIAINTFNAVGINTHPYYSTAGQETFLLGSKHPKFDMEDFAKETGLTEKNHSMHHCIYRTEEKDNSTETLSTLNNLAALRYYKN